MPEFPLLHIGDEWRQVRILIGSSTHYTVIDCLTGRVGRIEKWRVWQAASGPRLTSKIAA
jgi:hypothetical protein